MRYCSFSAHRKLAPHPDTASHAPFGPLTGLTYGNGLMLARAHDQNYWLTGISVDGSGLPLIDLTFGRDANGNLSGVTDNASSGRAATFTYTDNDRLDTAVGPWGSDDYTWDASGNRTRVDRTIGGTTYSDVATIASGTNKLTEIRDGSATLTKAFTLNGNGDMASQAVSGGTTFDYGYSPRKRLASVEANNVEVASYIYDHAGHRVVRTLPASSQVIHYIYGPGGELLAEHDGTTGALLREYVWLDGMALAQVGGSVSSPTFVYVHTGQIGEPIMLTDASQAKVWDVVNDPWGNALPLSTATVTHDLRFPGQWMQSETGLYQNWMRDYDPSLGRYIESDPIGLAGGSNLFGYVDGNPNSLIDPMGLRTATPAEVIKFGTEWWVERQVKRAVTRRIPVVGQALSIGDAIGAAAAVTLFLCTQDNGNDCAILYAQIKKVRDELARRVQEFREDTGNLPEFGRHSRHGHAQQFRNKQEQLRKLLRIADSKGCKAYDTDAWYLATMPLDSRYG